MKALATCKQSIQNISFPFPYNVRKIGQVLSYTCLEDLDPTSKSLENYAAYITMKLLQYFRYIKCIKSTILAFMYCNTTLVTERLHF